MPDVTQTTFPIRTAAILTNSYVLQDQAAANIGNFTDHELYVTLTKPAGFTSLDILIETSPDNVLWGDTTNKSTAAGTTTMYQRTVNIPATTWTASPRTVTVKIEEKSAYIRFSFKGNGTVVASSCFAMLVSNTTD